MLRDQVELCEVDSLRLEWLENTKRCPAAANCRLGTAKNLRSYDAALQPNLDYRTSLPTGTLEYVAIGLPAIQGRFTLALKSISAST